MLNDMELLRDVFVPDIDWAQEEAVGCLKRTDPTSTAKGPLPHPHEGPAGVHAVTWPGSSCFDADRLAPDPAEPFLIKIVRLFRA